MDFFLLGGDTRQVLLAGLLTADGHTVHTYALGQEGDDPDLDRVGEANVAVLPLPALRGEDLNAPLAETPPALARVLAALRPGQLVLAGKPPQALTAGAQDRGVTVVDYYDREELAVANAVPTSEGCIRLAMEALPVTLHGARALVLGFGRIGKVLCRQLSGLGTAVTAGARKDADLAWIAAEGYAPLRSDRLRDADLTPFDLVVNTVPAPILDREVLARLNPGAVVIDLASAPGGTDFAAAGELGVKAIFAPGLPGREAPLTAAGAIRTALYNILTEQGA